MPLLKMLQARGGTRRSHPIIIDVNLNFPGGREAAQQRIWRMTGELLRSAGVDAGKQGINAAKTRYSKQYLFGRLRGDLIQKLVRIDRETAPPADRAQDKKAPALYRIWPDFEVSRQTNASLSTIKADAAHNAFCALGEGIVWAVMDSGIDGNHPHFKDHKNLDLPAPLKHCDFTTFGTQSEAESTAQALIDEAGHGTHVAGIIAGGTKSGLDARGVQVEILATVSRKDEQGQVIKETEPLEEISGMAPKCKLLSLKVLDENGKGPVSNLIAAIEQIQEINANGRYIRVHGVNLSVGYDFDPKWFACGQSPLCVEVDRLVRSGVVVVVAAGNTGYGWNQSAAQGATAAGMDLTINDPGNAALAITVGSTHRDSPHIYGVSYFSSKGPTGDGRLKPDLIAPGEKIVSCDSGGRLEAQAAGGSVGAALARPNVIEARYKEDSGTS
ncbi:MAG: S8 family serine peptidase, partial [Geminicoccaceae bacterium]